MATRKAYRVIRGINYPDGAGGEKRAEPGDTVDDLPASAVAWMLPDGVIEPVDSKASEPDTKAVT